MAKRRLNKSHREAILARIEARLRSQNFKASGDRVAALDQRLAKRAGELAGMHFPLADMQVLAHYGAASTLGYLIVRKRDADGCERRRCSFDLDAPRLLPSPYTGRAVRVEHDDALFSLEKERNERAKSLERAVGKVLEDYRAAVYGTRNYEDLARVMPEILAWERDLFPMSTAVACLSHDTLARIQLDQKAVTP